MSSTLLGIPLPAAVSALGPASVRPSTAPRPSGRYRMQAPEAPTGSVLRVTTADRSTRFVSVVCPHEHRLFVDVDGNEVAFMDWEFATKLEVENYQHERRVVEYADSVEAHGAPCFAAVIRGLPRQERDGLLCAVIDLLRERRKDGRASQVAAYRFEERCGRCVSEADEAP